MITMLFDTETTGLNPETDLAFENGVILWDSETNKIKEFNQLINWKKIYSKFTTAPTYHIHHISDERVEEEGLHPLDSYSQFYKTINDFGHVDILCAFNTAFDLNFYIANLKCLISYYSKNQEEDEEILNKLDDCENLLKMLTSRDNHLIYDCMLYDRLYHFEVDYVKVKHNLNDVGLRYNIPEDPNAHNALADTKRTFKIYQLQLKELYENDVDVDKHLEFRFEKQYARDKAKYAANKKKNSKDLDYFGIGINETKYSGR